MSARAQNLEKFGRRMDQGVTVVPNEIKMLRYNRVIVAVPRRGGWILGAQMVRVLSQGVLGAFHGHRGDLVAVKQHLPSQLETLYATALRMVVYHLGLLLEELRLIYVLYSVSSKIFGHGSLFCLVVIPNYETVQTSVYRHA